MGRSAMSQRLTVRILSAPVCIGPASSVGAHPVMQQEPDGAMAAPETAGAPTATLFTNVRIFDGTHGRLSAPSNVLVQGNTIARISAGAIDAPGARRIDGRGRTLMPGLIDMHWHSMFAGIPIQTLMTADTGYINIVAGAESRKTLLRGFTTVRDVGGAVWG